MVSSCGSRRRQAAPTAERHSASRCETEWHATRDEQRERRGAGRSVSSSGAAATICSKLSRTSSSSLPRRYAINASTDGLLDAASARNLTTDQGPVRRARRARPHDAPRRSDRWRGARTSTASRVLPIPPGPTSVVSRPLAAGQRSPAGPSRAISRSGSAARGAAPPREQRSAGDRHVRAAATTPKARCERVHERRRPDRYVASASTAARSDKPSISWPRSRSRNGCPLRVPPAQRPIPRAYPR